MEGEDCWIGLTGENFKIRGPNYLKDRKKIMSEECVFKCLCCELVNSKTKMNHFSQRPVSLVQKLRAQGIVEGLISYLGEVQGNLCEYAQLFRGS